MRRSCGNLWGGCADSCFKRLLCRHQGQIRIALSPGALFAIETLGELDELLFAGDAAAGKAMLRTRMTDYFAEAQSAASERDAGDSDDGDGASEATQRPIDAGETSTRRTVVLTGATGFLGAFLLHALVKSAEWSDSRVVCLVRAPDAAGTLKR